MSHYDDAALDELFAAAKAMHARLRDEYIPLDTAYRLGYLSGDYDLFKRFEDAILAIGPLLPPDAKRRRTPDNRLEPFRE